MPRGSLLKAEFLNKPYMMCPSQMQTYMNVLSDEIPRAEAGVGVANNNVVYSASKNIAIIAIDGAMYKKGFNGACGETVVAYPDIIKAIGRAEADDDINTILFRVDTGGGSVAGAEEVRYRIKNSPLKTVTFYENIGASGGLWIFTASDEIYSAPTTWLGSIGVVVAYEEEDPDTKKKTIELVSKNAPNKRCSLNGDCKEKMQGMIDSIENDFFAVLKENTGFEQESLMQIFENGGIIKAEVAKEHGFIRDISHFSVLLGNLKSKTGETPMGAGATEKIPKVEETKTQEKILGGMAFNEKNFEVLMESRAGSKERIQALTDSQNVTASALATANATLASMNGRIESAIGFGISDAKTLTSMILAKTADEANTIAIDSKDGESTINVSDGGNHNHQNAEPKEDMEAYANSIKGSIK